MGVELGRLDTVSSLSEDVLARQTPSALAELPCEKPSKNACEGCARATEFAAECMAKQWPSTTCIETQHVSALTNASMPAVPEEVAAHAAVCRGPHDRATQVT